MKGNSVCLSRMHEECNSLRGQGAPKAASKGELDCTKHTDLHVRFGPSVAVLRSNSNAA